MDDRRLSIASSYYSQSQEAFDSHTHEDSSQLIPPSSPPPLVPHRSSYQVLQAQWLSIPASLTTVRAGHRGHPASSSAPSPVSSSSSAPQDFSILPTLRTSTRPPTSPQRESPGWNGQFRPLSSVEKLFPMPVWEDPISQARGTPQPAFLLPFGTDNSLRSKSSIVCSSTLKVYQTLI
jgi:hypothetical protein